MHLQREYQVRLASNSWSVWMETATHASAVAKSNALLPIREAYEWKRLNRFTAFDTTHPKTCFQFVKRMNGNESHGIVWVGRHVGDLASNSWSVWMETIKPLYTCPNCRDYLLPIREAYEWKPSCIARSFLIGFSSCFQFVKRMNGNNGFLPISCSWPRNLLPIREAYEWKQLKSSDHVGNNSKLASNSWSVWLETSWISRVVIPSRNLLPIREAYEWKQEVIPGNPFVVFKDTCFQFVKRMNGNSKRAKSPITYSSLGASHLCK